MSILYKLRLHPEGVSSFSKNLISQVREFSDLSSQYKAQVAENKALRQKLEKVERINSGPNWKTLYESLQVFYGIKKAFGVQRG